MSEVLACSRADRFKAAASISGITEFNYTASDSLDTCDRLFA